MKKRKAGTLKSGRSGRKVKSRKQAIAIGLSEARAAGAKVPKKTAPNGRQENRRKSDHRSAPDSADPVRRAFPLSGHYNPPHHCA